MVNKDQAVIIRPEDEPSLDEPMIIYRERVMNGDIQSETVHGPMPVKDWPDYATKHGL